MPHIDDPLLGQDLTALTLTSLNNDGAGNLSVRTAFNLVGVFVSIDPTLDVQSEDIRPTNVTGINMVPISAGEGVRVSCLQTSDAAQQITQAINDCPSRRFLIAWTQGREDFAGYYTLVRWNGGIKNRGANPVEAEFAPMHLTDVNQVTYGTH